eukprot:COSAG01_NODE_1301_length_10829_cov_20.185182_11_plen_80_part_00
MVVELEEVEASTMRELLWCLHTREAPDSEDVGLVALLGATHRFGCEVMQIQCESHLSAGIDVEQVCDVLLLRTTTAGPS